TKNSESRVSRTGLPVGTGTGTWPSAAPGNRCTDEPDVPIAARGTSPAAEGAPAQARPDSDNARPTSKTTVARIDPPEGNETQLSSTSAALDGRAGAVALLVLLAAPAGAGV